MVIALGGRLAIPALAGTWPVMTFRAGRTARRNQGAPTFPALGRQSPQLLGVTIESLAGSHNSADH